MASSVAGARAQFSSKSLSTDDPVVSPDWLHSNLKEPDLKVSPLVGFISTVIFTPVVVLTNAVQYANCNALVLCFVLI